MPHRHRINGRVTGTETIDPNNPARHWHMVNGDRTSSDNFGGGHSHTLNGELTGPPIEEGIKMQVEFKFNVGQITEVKQDEKFGDDIGVVEGYIATWDVDRGDWFGTKDQFAPGAFQASIADHLKRNRSIRLLSHHRQPIGHFPINTVREDNKGLFGQAHINLKVQEGREIYALIKQGAISDFSIGFSIDEDGFVIEGDLRTITKATIWEGSFVHEPMNPHASVTDVKTVVPYQDLPLADREREWDSTAAVNRVREFTDSDEEPTRAYRRAFLWFDSENPDVFSAYKLPIADVIDDRLHVIPQGVFAAAAAMRGARDGVQIPEGDRPGVIRHLERYYAKMDMPSPFGEERQFLLFDDVQNMTPKDLEKVLRDGKQFSKNAAKFISSKLRIVDNEEKDEDNSLKELLDNLRSIRIRR